MLKSHATIIELDISISDLKLNFTPTVGLWFAALNESDSSAKYSYFGSVYNVENIESQLLDYDNIGGINVEGDRSYIQVYDTDTLYKQNKSFMLSSQDGINYIIINFGLAEIGYYKDVVPLSKIYILIAHGLIRMALKQINITVFQLIQLSRI